VGSRVTKTISLVGNWALSEIAQLNLRKAFFLRLHADVELDAIGQSLRYPWFEYAQLPRSSLGPDFKRDKGKNARRQA
jgi:hypothetical protein